MMTKSTKLVLFILLLFSLLGVGVSAQVCSYSISGQLTDYQTGQIVPNQQIAIWGLWGVDTVTTNPNGVYQLTVYVSCDSGNVGFTTQVVGCSYLTAQGIGGVLNQTSNLDLTTCSPPPSCSISIQANVVAPGNVVEYSCSGSSPGATVQSITWNFGNGVNLTNVGNTGTYGYLYAGIYNITATVTWDNGCISSASDEVVINSGYSSCPKIISGYVTSGVAQTVVGNTTVSVYIPSMLGYAGGAYTTQTDINGYYSITAMAPCDTFIYANVVVSASGCNNTQSGFFQITPDINSYSKDLHICSNIASDSCEISVSAQLVNDSVYFGWSGNSTNGSTIQSVVWSFDGQVQNFATGGGIYTFPSPGVHTICATVNWSSGCSASACDTVITTTSMDTCTYTLTAQVWDVDSNLVVNQPVVVGWNGGSDTLFTNSNGVFYYTHHNSCDSAYLPIWVLPTGCSFSNNNTFILHAGQPLYATFLSCENSQINCNDTLHVSYSVNGLGITVSAGVQSPATFTWDFGDGNTGTGPNTSHQYANAGTYTVCVNVFISPICQLDSCFSVNITNIQPPVDSCTVDIHLTNLGGNNMGYSFLADSIFAGVPIYTEWNFGNGDSLYNSNGTYNYSSPGIYQVCVTMQFSGGCIATDCDTILIGNNMCAYTFGGYVTDSASNRINNVPVSLQIQGNTWNTVTNANGAYLFSVSQPCDSGFTANITVDACNETHISTVHSVIGQNSYHHNFSVCPPILDSCHAWIGTSVNIDSVTYHWVGNSQYVISPQSVVWDMGDGTILNNNANWGNYQYTAPGIYTICATVTWASGCSVTSCDTVVIQSAQQQSICGCVNYGPLGSEVSVNCGSAYLIRYGNNNSAVIVDSVGVTQNGYCFYGDFSSAAYTVLVQPCATLIVNEGVLPTYLGNSIYWQNADTAWVGMNYYNHNCIALVSTQAVQGPAQVGGTILWGDDKAPGDAVVGVNVFLMDGNGQIIKMSVTDAEGFYSFANLPYGNYQIYPEYVGYTTHPISVMLSPENENVEVNNFYLGFGVFTSLGMKESLMEVHGLFPNPAFEMANISITSKESGIGNIRITDLTGKSVSQTAANIIQGQQNIGLNIQHLNAGIYTVTLTLNGQQMHVKLIKR